MNMSEEKVADIFAQFVNSGNTENELKQIYESMPFLNSEQQRVLTLYHALAVKHNSSVLAAIHDSIVVQLRENRKLGWRYTRLVESMALYKHFKGYRAAANMSEGDK